MSRFKKETTSWVRENIPVKPWVSKEAGVQPRRLHQQNFLVHNLLEKGFYRITLYIMYPKIRFNKFINSFQWDGKKIKRREEEGGEIYKNARSTLPKTCRKKLLEKTNWYKKRKRDTEDDGEKYLEDKERRVGGRKKIKKERINEQRMDDGNKVKAVMFKPYTTIPPRSHNTRESRV